MTAAEKVKIRALAQEMVDAAVATQKIADGEYEDPASPRTDEELTGYASQANAIREWAERVLALVPEV